MEFDLFVMVTDWRKDRAETTDEDEPIVNLNRGVALCGVEGSQSNPDGRAERFPFDRKIKETSLSEFSVKYDNMLQGKIIIQHVTDG